MKRIAFIICVLLLATACKSKKATVKTTAAPEPKYVKLDMSDVDAAQKKKAYELGKRVLMTCNTSRFKPFTTSEATDQVIQNTTQARLTKTCHKFRLKYGDFKDIRLVEVHRSKKNNITLYRYKADYSKKIANKELRVMMNDDNKITALKSTDWVENFKPL